MAKQFLKECKETRDAFVKVAGTYNISDNLELRTEIDSLLIMYDQLCERVRLADVDTGENNALLPDVSKRTCRNCHNCVANPTSKYNWDKHKCFAREQIITITNIDEYKCDKWTERC